MKILVLFLSLVFTTAEADDVYSWSYNCSSENDPKHWGGFCHGKHNSPINIVRQDTVEIESPGWNLTGWDKIQTWKVKNMVHTVQFDLIKEGSVTTAGGDLPGKYNLVSFNFHWGAENIKGGEHTVDGITYPLEMHFIHVKNEYKTMEEALNSSDTEAIAIMTFLFEINKKERDNHHLMSLMQGVSKAVEAPEQEDILFKLYSYPSRIGMDALEGDYWRYLGGLTVPNCNEQVVWTIFQTPIPISTDQMNVFRSLDTGMFGTELYRETQPLNDRVVLHYMAPEVEEIEMEVTNPFDSIKSFFNKFSLF